jgi:hypothetical protein
MNNKTVKRPILFILVGFVVFIFSACTVQEEPQAKQSKTQVNKKSKQQGIQKKKTSEKQHRSSSRKKARNSSQVKILFNRLKVAKESTVAYDRDYFKHWSDLDGNGCDTRQDVLYRENLKKGFSCKDSTGRWFSAYDRLVTTDSSSFDVDHMVPLSEAWDSGASFWNEQKRERYANDLYPYSLIAVSASSNRSKSDQDPAEWMPTNKSFSCQYTARWIAVKSRWKLTIDSTEKRAIQKLLSSCSNRQLILKKKVAFKPINKPNSKPKPGKLDPKFSSCSQAISNGYGNYRRGLDPEYSWYRDADNDGLVCEK